LISKRLKISLNVENDNPIEEAVKLLKHDSYKYAFWHSFVPPHRVEIILGPLSDVGVENWLSMFNSVEGLKFRAFVRDYTPEDHKGDLDWSEDFDAQEESISYKVKTTWKQDEIVTLCRKIEAFAPKFGYHVGFTGGGLYKDGERKDADIILYPHNDPANVTNWEGMQEALEDIGVFIVAEHCGWLKKAKFGPFKCIDFFFMTRIMDQNGKVSVDEYRQAAEARAESRADRLVQGCSPRIPKDVDGYFDH